MATRYTIPDSLDLAASDPGIFWPCLPCFAQTPYKNLTTEESVIYECQVAENSLAFRPEARR
jgi:hypothetical protein